MTLAVAADAAIVWLLYFRQSWNPEVGMAEWFWVRTFIFAGLYAILQQWSQSLQTGGADNASASFDKLLAVTPAIAVLGLELFWLGATGNVFALSWRHHLVGGMIAAYSVVDYMTTDILNQRLSAREMKMAPGA
jgi:hypothetical protein